MLAARKTDLIIDFVSTKLPMYIVYEKPAISLSLTKGAGVKRFISCTQFSLHITYNCHRAPGGKSVGAKCASNLFIRINNKTYKTAIF